MSDLRRFKAPHTHGGITRRGFFRATAAGGIVSAVIGVSAGCHHSSDEGSGKSLVLDKNSATKVLDAYSSEDYTAEPSQSYIAAGKCASSR